MTAIIMVFEMTRDYAIIVPVIVAVEPITKRGRHGA
jgi:H+/Cl- antiporter ClcA